MPVEHLYVHVPYCATKCRYCAFYSLTDGDASMAGYVDAVLAELRHYRQQLDLRPRTIFFGGGTPSLLPVPLWQKLLAALPVTDAEEFTIECNPATVTREKLETWRAGGVNRLSLGVQSFDAGLLEVLGRIHSASQAIETFQLMRAAGFDNINVDLMFALPGQTPAQWRDTLAQAIALQPEHISAYNLTLEEDTEFFRQAITIPVPEEQVAYYETTVATLAAAGYEQYEISNYAKPGRECAHNLAYWRIADYLGLGPSACSTIGPRRWENVSDTSRYIAALQGCSGGSASRRSFPESEQPAPHRGAATPALDVLPCPAIIASEEHLTPAQKDGERAAFGLRTRRGIPAHLVRGRWDAEIAELEADELVEWTGDSLRLTQRGLHYADEVAARFV
jgi:oxygen-independent coproporphyrinogen-3 oxidase